MALVCTAGALAQSVVIYDTEGQPHKYNTDRVKDITFIKPGVAPQEVTFTSLDAHPYSGGYVDLTFSTDDGKTLMLYVCGPRSAKWLQDGVYNVDPSNGEWTVDTDPDYSFFINGESRTSPVSGTMTVSRAEAVFTINFDFVMSDDSRLVASWIGEIPNYSPYLILPDASQANVIEVRDQVPGEFYIKFNDASYTYEMAVDFYAEAGSAKLPAGVYTYSDEKTPGTYGPSSYMNLYSPYASLTFRGPITVSYIGEEIRVVMDLQFDDERQGTVIYQGQIDFPQVETPGITFTEVSAAPYSGGYVDLTFNTEDGKTLMLYVCGTRGSSWLEDGVYTVSPSNAPMTVDSDPDYSYFQDGSSRISPTSGSMTVSRDESVYTIDFDFVMTGGVDFKAKYVGEVANYSPFVSLADAQTATVVEVRDQVPGQYYIKLAGNTARRYEMIIDFYADPQSTRLPAGTYTYSDDKTPGTYGPASRLEMFAPYASVNYTGPITVSYQGDNILINCNLDLSDGRKATVKYNGPIEFPQVVAEHLFTNAAVVDTWNGGAAIKLDISDNKYLYLECWFEDDVNVWPTGTYTLSDSLDPFTIDDDAYYSYLSDDEQTTGLSEGTMTISCENGIYTISVDMVLINGEALQGDYVGKLGGNMSQVVDLNLVRCTERSLTGQIDGEFYFELTSSNYKQEIRLDLIAAAGSQTLPAGTYTFSESKTPGTLSPASLVELYNPYFHSYATAGSQATVSYDGDQVVIEIEMALDNNRRAVGTYRGSIAYINE